MSKVNFHQFFSEELKEFHAIIIIQQRNYKDLLKYCENNPESDETVALEKLKESIDTATQFFRGFSDLLYEGKMAKIKMNIESIIKYIKNSNNSYLKNFYSIFDEALEKMSELALIENPSIIDLDGNVIYQKEVGLPHKKTELALEGSLKKSCYIIVSILLLSITVFDSILLSISDHTMLVAFIFNMIIFGIVFKFYEKIITFFIKRNIVCKLAIEDRNELLLMIDYNQSSTTPNTKSVNQSENVSLEDLKKTTAKNSQLNRIKVK